MLMTADSLRKTQYEGTINFFLFFFYLCERRGAGGMSGKSVQKQKCRKGCGGGVKKEGRRSGGNGRSPGSSRFPYALTVSVNGRQLVLEKDRERKSGSEKVSRTHYRELRRIFRPRLFMITIIPDGFRALY